MSYVGVRCYKIYSPSTGHYTGVKFSPSFINSFNRMDLIDQCAQINDIRTRLEHERGLSPRDAGTINRAHNLHGGDS